MFLTWLYNASDLYWRSFHRLFSDKLTISSHQNLIQTELGREKPGVRDCPDGRLAQRYLTFIHWELLHSTWYWCWFPESTKHKTINGYRDGVMIAQFREIPKLRNIRISNENNRRSTIPRRSHPIIYNTV